MATYDTIIHFREKMKMHKMDLSKFKEHIAERYHVYRESFNNITTDETTEFKFVKYIPVVMTIKPNESASKTVPNAIFFLVEVHYIYVMRTSDMTKLSKFINDIEIYFTYEPIKIDFPYLNLRYWKTIFDNSAITEDGMYELKNEHKILTKYRIQDYIGSMLPFVHNCVYIRGELKEFNNDDTHPYVSKSYDIDYFTNDFIKDITVLHGGEGGSFILTYDEIFVDEEPIDQSYTMINIGNIIASPSMQNLITTNRNTRMSLVFIPSPDDMVRDNTNKLVHPAYLSVSFNNNMVYPITGYFKDHVTYESLEDERRSVGKTNYVVHIGDDYAEKINKISLD